MIAGTGTSGSRRSTSTHGRWPSERSVAPAPGDADRREDQPVDVPAQHQRQRLCLDRGILLAVGDQHRVAVAARTALDLAGEQREERVRDVRDHEADRRRAPQAQAAGEVVDDEPGGLRLGEDPSRVAALIR